MGLQHRSYKKGIQKAYKQKREAHPALASLFKAPENCPTCRNEQLRTSRRYIYITPYTLAMPTARMHHRLTSIKEVYRYNIPNALLCCFVLDKYEIFSGLRTVKTKA